MNNKISLNGLTVIVTRPLAQANNLCALLKNHQASIVQFPVISITSTTNINDAKKKLKAFSHYDIVIFVSTNAVHYSMSLAKELNLNLRNRHLAVIGLATKSALEAYGYQVNIYPKKGFTSEALALHPSMQSITGDNILIVRGQHGREYLREKLKSRGAIVDYAEVYQRQIPAQRNPIDLCSLPKHKTAILINSVESLQNLWALCSPQEHKWIKDVVIIVGGERIWKAADSAGLGKNSIMAQNSSDAEMLNTLLKKYKEYNK